MRPLAMRVLEYEGLDVTGLTAQYRKVCDAISRRDFHAAQVKKLVGHEHYYRARLDDRNRLLFTLLRHGEEVCALILDVIRNHDYAASRFLRGATIDETRIPAIDAQAACADAAPLRYLHPERIVMHVLDKPLSFDDAQHAIYVQPCPLIVAGSAGSGKTALTLEKLKHAEGETLYVTHSAYLAQNARELYFAHGFEHGGQDAVFLSFREFIESIHVPSGREARWSDFSAWFARVRQAFKGIDAHQAFEEIRGVIGAAPGGALSPDAYAALGVRQSIFLGEERARLYELFEKYRSWLEAERLFDLNLVAQDWLARAEPRYDFVVIDEVQDFTPVQLALVLRTLKQPGRFLLCGDSNQIVHPNFFSWSQVKSLFWHDPRLAERQQLQVLSANYRNGTEATRIANTLLRIKQRRFGSIDRESNFLVDAVGGEAGSVALLPDREALTRDLDQKTRKSTRFAVLVLREEDKSEARKRFATPLLFSIHEAKGLEYESIVLYRFVSDQRARFAELVAGVQPADLADESLDYHRARDKTDKSLEVYKFFVNALYVALTRAVKNVYLIESDTSHPLFALLGMGEAAALRVESREATTEEWQREARKLELQGKQEQAEAIRRTILRETPAPWPVMEETRVRGLLQRVFGERAPGAKPRQQLYEYATCFDEPGLAAALAQQGGFEAARAFRKQRASLGYKSLMPYYASNPKEVLRLCEQHGVEHRSPMNLSPLMAAATAGNLALVDALLERGADREACDHYGRNALHWALLEAMHNRKYADERIAAVYERVAPPCIDLGVDERLVRIDRHQSEYLLLQTLWALFKSRFTNPPRRYYGLFEAQAVLDAWRHLPGSVVRPERNRRQHISSLLSRNEIERDYAYNRALFRRIKQGWYQFNPALRVRRRCGEEQQWVPVLEALNLALVGEFCDPTVWDLITRQLHEAGRTAPAQPLIHAGEVARLRTRREAAQSEHERILAALSPGTQPPTGAIRPAPRGSEPKPNTDAEVRTPRWGSPQARARELARQRQRIEEDRRTRRAAEESKAAPKVFDPVATGSGKDEGTP